MRKCIDLLRTSGVSLLVPALIVSLTWLFFSSQLTICRSLLSKSCREISEEKLSSFDWTTPFLSFCFSRSFNCSSWISFPFISLYTGGSQLSFTATSFRSVWSSSRITSARCFTPKSSPSAPIKCMWRWPIFLPTLLIVTRALGSSFLLFFFWESVWMAGSPPSVSVEKEARGQGKNIWQPHAGLRVGGFVGSGKLRRLIGRRVLRLKTNFRKPRDITGVVRNRRQA